VLAKAGSPLAGQGQFIIDMSLKYGIPVEIALAMWKVEGNYGTLGASVANKNPGNSARIQLCGRDEWRLCAV
jgi:hypothetical protein